MVLIGESAVIVRNFWQSVALVLTGTLVAQSIPIVGALVIARLYAPSEFGLFSAWLGMAMLAAVIVTGRFEMTLAVEVDGAPRDFAMFATLSTIFIVSLLFALATVVIYFLIGLPDQVNFLMATLFVPTASLAGTMHAYQALAAAEGNYRNLSWIRITQALIVTGVQIGAGFVSHSAAGLMIGQVVGLLVSVGFSIYLRPINTFHTCCNGRFWINLQAFWYDQRRFPMLALPADIISATTGLLPLILITNRFGAEAGGVFALTLRVLGAPIGLLAAAVLDVYKRGASTSYRVNGHFTDEFNRTFWMLATGGVALALSVIAVADRLFVVAFGETWRQAGTIAGWLMPMFALRFVASPLSYGFYITDKQHIDLTWQCTLLAMTITAFTLTPSFEGSVRLYSGGYSLLYVIYILLSYHCSKGKQR